ncbi:hypothetical protein [Actinoplanes regularis]|uniref:hypothetical protein n=1 Tax=Actinoplanes regularis TaxID=52697 RepID=UPI0024A53FDE|nr:hypothetical protein [Actinoplanes regularis]GLW31879.1 hypothetical protein Areg01_48180 [Actinoplanes regularis]
MTVQAVVIGISADPVTVKPQKYDPGEVYLSFADGLGLFLRVADIERLSAALDRAREVLKANASNQINRE